MENAIVEKPKMDVTQWKREEIDLIKDTVAKGATDNELKLFLYRCKNLQLDPLKPGMIHFIKYGNNPGTIVIGIDGMRSRAQSTGKMKGAKTGILRANNGACMGAWAEMHALRMAFPNELGGLYGHEEMDQARPVVSVTSVKPEVLPAPVKEAK